MGRLDAVNQRLQFVGAAARDAGHVALAGEVFGNGATGCVAAEP